MDPLDDYVSESETLTLDDFIPAVQDLIEMQGNSTGFLVFRNISNVL